MQRYGFFRFCENVILVQIFHTFAKKRDMTTIRLSTNNLQFVHLFENLANVLNVPFEKMEENTMFSKSMQKALDDEKKGRISHCKPKVFMYVS